MSAPSIDPETGLDTTELDLMLAGKPYIARSPYRAHVASLVAAKVQAFNREPDMEKRSEFLRSFVKNGSAVERPTRQVALPFYCEYVGRQRAVRCGTLLMSRRGLLSPWATRSISDPTARSSTLHQVSRARPRDSLAHLSAVTIGSRTLIGPNVSIYAAQHPTAPEARNGIRGREWAAPIEIGHDCWIGGNVVILGGVTIGEGSTVGAGSVVTRDVPERCVAVGNPARVIKRIPVPEMEMAEGA
jgi:maltose O-acetyltransferase